MCWVCGSPSNTVQSPVLLLLKEPFLEEKEGPARGSGSEREEGKLWQIVEHPFRKFGGRGKRKESGRVRVGFLGET